MKLSFFLLIIITFSLSDEIDIIFNNLHENRIASKEYEHIKDPFKSYAIKKPKKKSKKSKPKKKERITIIEN